MAGDAAGEGEALEELLHALLIAGDVGVDLGVAAVEPVLRDHGVAAVAGTGEVDHIEVVALDDAVQVRVDEVLARAGAPVADDGLLEIALFERALKQGVIEQVELAGGQVVRGAPVGVELPELLPVQRRLLESRAAFSTDIKYLPPLSLRRRERMIGLRGSLLPLGFTVTGYHKRRRL